MPYMLLFMFVLWSQTAWSRECSGDAQTPISSVVSVESEVPGSGVVVSASLVAMTAHQAYLHSRVAIYTCTKKVVYGTVVARFPVLDLALVRSDTLIPAPPIRVRRSPLRSHDMVRTIGHPDGEAWVVSAPDIVWRTDAQVMRPVPSDDPDQPAVIPEKGLVDSSALGRYRSSGGALIDSEGQLVGIVTNGVIIPQSATSRRMGTYSRPIHALCPHLPHLDWCTK